MTACRRRPISSAIGSRRRCELIECAYAPRAPVWSRPIPSAAAPTARCSTQFSDGGRIFEAWSDEPWVLDGAAVRVSLICFDGGNGNRHAAAGWSGRAADQRRSDRVTADDLTKAARLPENAGVAFMGDTKGGAFDVPGELARQWLASARQSERPARIPMFCGPGSTAWTSHDDRPANGSSISVGR